MRKHIILGRHRFLHKKHLPHALHYHQQSHKHGLGTAAHKKDYEGLGEGMKHLKIKEHKAKPLRFKL